MQAKIWQESSGNQMEESQQQQKPSKFHRKIQAQDGYRTKKKCQNLTDLKCKGIQDKNDWSLQQRNNRCQ